MDVKFKDSEKPKAPAKDAVSTMVGVIRSSSEPTGKGEVKFKDGGKK